MKTSVSLSRPWLERDQRQRHADLVKVVVFCALAISLKCVEAFQPRAFVGYKPRYEMHQQPERRKLVAQPCTACTQGISHAKQRPRSNPFPFHRSFKAKITAMPMFLSTSEEGRVSSKSRATSVYVLILVNLAVFVAGNVLQIPFVSRNLYMYHRRWKWWQPLTACFCHADRHHLSSNLFLLLLFGRSVEDDQGAEGLLFCYAFCGILSSLISLFLLPRYTVSLGASGAVFGLFAVSTLGKLSWSDLNWKKLVEIAVLGEFVFRQIVTEATTAASGGTAGINHVAHLSGAAAGAMLVFGMRGIVGRFEKAELEKKKKRP